MSDEIELEERNKKKREKDFRDRTAPELIKNELITCYTGHSRIYIAPELIN